MAAFYPLFLTLFPYRVQVNYLFFLFRARTFILPPSLLAFVFEAKAWTGRGSGGAIRESTGWDHNFSQRSQKSFSQRKAEGLRPPPGPMETPQPCGFTKRSAAPVPRRAPRTA